MNKAVTVDFAKNDGLVPAIIQDAQNKEVLMLGYMNQESLQKTIETKYVHFWSRSRKELWLKGETSGNKLKVVSITTDCDLDTLLVLVQLEGKNVCHTGEYSCFFNNIV
jgi:phosphoribosyl-AMP cyclohydrolase